MERTTLLNYIPSTAMTRPQSDTSRLSTLISSRRLREAFSMLRPQVTQHGDWQLSDRLSKTEETYRYMIHYMVEGMSDEGRARLYSTIVEDLCNISDILDYERKLPLSSSVLASTTRLARMRGETLSMAADQWKSAYSKYALVREVGALTPDIRTGMENTLSHLFDMTASLLTPTKEDIRALRSILDDAEMPYMAKAQLIASLTLSTLEFYQIDKLMLLADIVDQETDDRLVARALAGVMLILARYSRRTAADRRLADRFALWQDNIALYTKVREVLVNILRTLDTDRISKKMQEEIIPELMKMRPDIMNKMQNIDKEEALEAIQENPEWQEMFDKSGLGDKLRELSEMQSEGADLMMASFSNLKNYPFFNDMSAWFLPFYTDHSIMNGNEAVENESIRRLLSLDGLMCDSDKYSFACTLTRLPRQQQEMMTSQLDAQLDQLAEQMSGDNLKKKFPIFATEVTKYIRDLFRFYSLFRKHEEFYNPFAEPFPVLDIPYLSSLLDNDEILGIVGEFYFRRGYYDHALKFYDIMEQRDPSDRSIIEKKAYALQCTGQNERAIEYYTRAELLGEPSRWLLHKLAAVSRTLGKYDLAAKYYTLALESDPDNITLLIGLGTSLAQQNKLKEALNCFYKSEFLKPGREDIRRAIAWTELLAGHYDKSENYMQRILTSTPTANDMLNAGHLYLLKRDFKQSARYYGNALHLFADGDVFDQALDNDLETLKSIGADEVELRLIIDHIKYISND